MPEQQTATTQGAFDIADFKKFAELAKEKKELEAKLNGVKDKIASMQEPLMEQLINSGMQEVRLQGGVLIYQRTDITAKAGKPGHDATDEDWNAACDALEAIGLGEFSKRRFMHPTIKSYVSGLVADAAAEGIEYDEVSELLPPELREVLTVGTVTKLQANGV